MYIYMKIENTSHIDVCLESISYDFYCLRYANVRQMKMINFGKERKLTMTFTKQFIP